jgi:Ran GTPase-activating protein (RanGAP) involved in mRNA processing and transport
VDFTYKGLSGGAAPLIVDMIKSCESLEQLLLSRNDLGDGFVDTFAAGMEAVAAATAAPPLTLLDVGQCALTSAACARLPAILSAATSIVLSANKLGSGAGTALGAALRASALTSLELNDCGLGDVGVAGLAAGLSECTSLQKLFVGNNGISGTGACTATVPLHLFALARALNSPACGCLAPNALQTVCDLTARHFGESPHNPGRDSPHSPGRDSPHDPGRSVTAISQTTDIEFNQFCRRATTNAQLQKS